MSGGRAQNDGRAVREQGRRVYAVVARVPTEGVALFAAYEARVLPLLADHGGTLERRLRSADGAIELHLLSFPSQEAFVAYRDDGRRREQRHLLEKSGAAIELLELYDVELAGGDGPVTRLTNKPSRRDLDPNSRA